VYHTILQRPQLSVLSELCCAFHSYSAKGRWWKDLSTIDLSLSLSLSLCLTLKPLQYCSIEAWDLKAEGCLTESNRSKCWKREVTDERQCREGRAEPPRSRTDILLASHTILISVPKIGQTHMIIHTLSHNTCKSIYTWVIFTMQYYNCSIVHDSINWIHF